MIYQTTYVFSSDLALGPQSRRPTELRGQSSVSLKKAVSGSVDISFGPKAECFSLLAGVTNGHKRLLNVLSALTSAFYSTYMIYQTTYVFSSDLAARIRSRRSSELRGRLSVSLKKAVSRCVGTNFGCNAESFSPLLVLVVFLTAETFRMIDV